MESVTLNHIFADLFTSFLPVSFTSYLAIYLAIRYSLYSKLESNKPLLRKKVVYNWQVQHENIESFVSNSSYHEIKTVHLFSPNNTKFLRLIQVLSFALTLLGLLVSILLKNLVADTNLANALYLCYLTLYSVFCVFLVIMTMKEWIHYRSLKVIFEEFELPTD